MTFFGFQTIVNSSLWLRHEPNNRSPRDDWPEQLVALEFTEPHANGGGGGSGVVGFNDVDGSGDIPRPLLCEYRETSRCPPNSTRLTAGKSCVGVYRDATNADEARERCASLVDESGGIGSLPSIHDDATNAEFAGEQRRERRAQRRQAARRFCTPTHQRAQMGRAVRQRNDAASILASLSRRPNECLCKQKRRQNKFAQEF